MAVEPVEPTSMQQAIHADLIQLYEELSPRLYRYAARLLGDADLAEECVSETFSRLLQALRRGSGPRENPKGYLYQTAHHWISDYYRAQSRVVTLEHDWIADPLPGPGALVAVRQETERVRAALMRLTSEQRQVIMLRYYEQWSHEEIAGLTGKTSEATRALQHRAVSALRQLLIENDVE